MLAISFQLRLLLEQAARDNGFELEVASGSSDWLSFRSSRVPLRIWLGGSPGDLYFVGLSQSPVARALGGTPAAAGPGRAYGVKAAAPLPPGASSARSVTGVPELHRLLRRAFQLSATLPDELLHTFEKAVEGLPRATEAERLVAVERVGQSVYGAGSTGIAALETGHRFAGNDLADSAVAITRERLGERGTEGEVIPPRLQGRLEMPGA